MMDALSERFGRWLSGLALLGCLLLLAMMLIIVADVALRNLVIPGMPIGLSWSNEVSELMLYLITMCVAPWLLRQGQHIRVDIVLQAVPPRMAWAGMGGRCTGLVLLFGAGLVWRTGHLGQLCSGLLEHQDAGHARVVVACTAASCVLVAVHRNGVSHASIAERRARSTP